MPPKESRDNYKYSLSIYSTVDFYILNPLNGRFLQHGKPVASMHKISHSHDSAYEEFCLMVPETMQYGRKFLMFQKNILLPSANYTEDGGSTFLQNNGTFYQTM